MAEDEKKKSALAPIWESIGKAVGPVVAEYVAPYVARQLSALLPVIVAAAVDALAKRVEGVADSLLTPVPELAEEVREAVNQIPDIDIPVLSDIFDLSEWLKKKE